MESKYAEYLRQAKEQHKKAAKKPRDLLKEALTIKNKLIDDKGRISAYKIATELEVSLSQAYLLKHQIESQK